MNNVMIILMNRLTRTLLARLARDKPVAPTKWFVAALDRATGEELWKQPLPSEPVYDGICLAHDGSVLVQLLDGSMVCIGEQNGL